MWRIHFMTELERLRRDLPEGSDSWRPHRPGSKVIEIAQKIVGSVQREDLPLPLLVAGSDGSLQIKWRFAKELSFFVSSDAVEFLQVYPQGSMEEGSLKNPEQVRELVDWLLAA